MLSQAKKLGVVFFITLMVILVAFVIGTVMIINAKTFNFSAPADFFNENRVLFTVIRLTVLAIVWANWKELAALAFRGEDDSSQENKKLLFSMRDRLLLCFLAVEIFIVQGFFGYLMGWVF